MSNTIFILGLLVTVFFAYRLGYYSGYDRGWHDQFLNPEDRWSGRK